MDDATNAVARTAKPWIGVLWITALPLRLLQVHVITQIIALGRDARFYGTYLSGLAMATMAAMLLAIWGRSVYVQACRLSLEFDSSPGLAAFRVGIRTLMTHAYTAMLCEALFFMMLWSFVAAPAFVVLAGLAAACAHLEDRPGLLGPLRTVLKAARSLPKGMLIVYTLAVPVVLLNLYVLAQFILWTATGVAGWDLSAWQYLLNPHPILPAEPLVSLLLVVGTIMILEPFWLSSLTIYVSRLGERATGEDLRRRFTSLREGGQ